MNSAISQVVNGALILAVCLMAIYLVMKSKARTWRMLGWFACIMSLTLVMIEGYGWYRRGDWQIKSAFDLWNEMQRSSLIWLSNTSARPVVGARSISSCISPPGWCWPSAAFCCFCWITGRFSGNASARSRRR